MGGVAYLLCFLCSAARSAHEQPERLRPAALRVQDALCKHESDARYGRVFHRALWKSVPSTPASAHNLASTKKACT
jgi:hypothetical protein